MIATTSAQEIGAVSTGNWVAQLRNFITVPKAGGDEFCELCTVQLPATHPHLAEPAAHRLMCVCRGCAMLLGGRADRKFVRVPTDVRRLANFRFSNAEWDALGIPIGLAFFYHSSADQRIVAFYPGPAGSTECTLDFDKSAHVFDANPVFSELEPDVEALLANRVDGAHDYYVVPIDRCYQLVGLIRTQWRGISGGPDAAKAIERFFADLRDSHREVVHA